MKLKRAIRHLRRNYRAYLVIVALLLAVVQVVRLRGEIVEGYREGYEAARQARGKQAGAVVRMWGR